ncbi:MAG: HEAT repeat domain-containing protein [Candidatus Zixiibacteriota bacterium]
MKKPDSAKILFAIGLNLFLYGSYFYNLIRQHWTFMVQKQSALESIKVIAVPGTGFLNKIDSFAIFNSSLFYLALLGMMFLVFTLFSLLINSHWKRGLFLSIGFLAVLILAFNDKINISLPFVIAISFASFYLITLSCSIKFSLKEILISLSLMVLISLSLFYGSKNNFFLKTRDRILFDTGLGNKVILFYYNYSPLAAGLVSLDRGIYEGLIYYEGFQDEKPAYIGKGIFLSGKKEVEPSSDFSITKEGEKFFIKNRYGKKITLPSTNVEEIEKAIERLFSMKGLLLLNKIALYFFPAGFFILFLVVIKWITKSKKIFIFSGSGLATALVIFIFYLSLTGNNPPKSNSIKSMNLLRYGLSIAYDLSNMSEIPEPYIPVIRKMAVSESPALKYWGANLLGVLGDPKEAQTLIDMLNDPSLNVRYMAAVSLFKLLKEGSFSHLLIRLFNDPSWYVRCKVFSVFLNAGLIPSPVMPGQAR